MPDLNRQIVEVRYKPNPKILDYRGTWAEGISEHLNLERWEIIENRVDVYNEDMSLHAFVSFKNAGFTAKNSQTRNFFSDKALRFFKYLYSLDGFETNLHIKRIGVRSRFCREYQGDFGELRDKYTNNYLSLSEGAKETINAKLVDIGGPLNFEDRLGNFNTMSGPMKKEQIERFFETDEDIPSVGLYFDVDYWVRPDSVLNEREVLTKIRQFAESTWERFTALSKIIIGE